MADRVQELAMICFRICSHLLSKNMMTVIYRPVVLPVVLWVSEMWSVSVRRGHWLRVSEMWSVSVRRGDWLRVSEMWSVSVRRGHWLRVSEMWSVSVRRSGHWGEYLEPICREEQKAGGKCLVKSIRICTFSDSDGIETEKDEEVSACSLHRRWETH